MAKWREAKFRFTQSVVGKLTLWFLAIAALEAVVLGVVSFYSLHRSIVLGIFQKWTPL